MAGQQDWEQGGPDGADGVDDIVQRYLGDDGNAPAGGSGPGSPATSSNDQASGEGSDLTEQIAERVLAQLETRLDAMRQDLQSYAERTAQSFSDRTAHRLTQQQRERMQMADRILGQFREQLGPEYEDMVRQARIAALLDAGEGQGEGQEAQLPIQGQQPQQPPRAAGQSGDFANVYLSRQLGDPSEWSAEDQAAIQRDLAQAGDWVQWMAVVDRYAGQRGRTTVQGPQFGGGAGNVARVQPVGGAGGRAQVTLEQLNAAYDRAAAEGDLDAMQQIGKKIDAALARSR